MRKSKWAFLAGASIALAIFVVLSIDMKRDVDDSFDPSVSDVAEAKLSPDAASGSIESIADIAPARFESPCELETHYVVTEKGSMIKAYSCEKKPASDPHPYKTYDNETLGNLAYSDAMAAEVLAMRLMETDERAAISLILRSSALSGDSRPIVHFAHAYPKPTMIDGQPVLESIRVRYVLNAVASLVDDEPVPIAFWEGRIREHFTDPQSEIDRLQKQANIILSQMREVQVEVLGSQTIKGTDDV